MLSRLPIVCIFVQYNCSCREPTTLLLLGRLELFSYGSSLEVSPIRHQDVLTCVRMSAAEESVTKLTIDIFIVR
jgi:hypothetical protein